MKKVQLLIILICVSMILSCASHNSLLNAKDKPVEYSGPTIEDYFENHTPESVYATLDSLNHVVPPPYKLASGDKMKIYVYDEPELDTDLAIVKQDGTLSFRLVGEVYVAGLTVTEATALIEQKLSAYILHPKVSIIIIEQRSTTVTLLGKVTHPGTFEIRGSMRLLDAIANAGGFALGFYPSATVELADLERTFLIRNNSLVPINFVELVQNGDTRYNIPLLDRDYIFVPSAVSKEIYVIGEVNQVGHYFYQENMTLMQSIAYAQGTKSTSLTTAYVIRGNINQPHLYKIHMRPILHARKQDFILKANDIVFIPKHPIAKWNDVVTMALPSLQAIQSAWIVNDIIKSVGKQ